MVSIQTQTQTQTQGRAAVERVPRIPWSPERRLAVAAATAFVVEIAALWFSWPLGVALGLVLGVVATVAIGRAMHGSAQLEELTDVLDLTGEDDLRQDVRRLRVRLGDDWPTFGRAAELVTRTQWASVAGLQRELRVSTAQAQHVMLLLEREGFVGPARGAQRRLVRVPADRADELQGLLRA